MGRGRGSSGVVVVCHSRQVDTSWRKQVVLSRGIDSVVKFLRKEQVDVKKQIFLTQMTFIVCYFTPAGLETHYRSRGGAGSLISHCLQLDPEILHEIPFPSHSSDFKTFEQNATSINCSDTEYLDKETGNTDGVNRKLDVTSDLRNTVLPVFSKRFSRPIRCRHSVRVCLVAHRSPASSSYFRCRSHRPRERLHVFFCTASVSSGQMTDQGMLYSFPISAVNMKTEGVQCLRQVDFQGQP